MDPSRVFGLQVSLPPVPPLFLFLSLLLSLLLYLISSSLFLIRSSSSLSLLILCCSILPSTGLQVFKLYIQTSQELRMLSSALLVKAH